MDITEAYERLMGLAEKARDAGIISARQITSASGSVTDGPRRSRQEMMAAVLPGDEVDQMLIRKCTVLDVGDRTFATPGNDYEIGLSLPVASDIWYLAIGVSILPFNGENYQENAAKILGFLSKYLVRLDNIKPLKSLQSYKNINTYSSVYYMRTIFDADQAPHVIREARFETWVFNKNTEFPSTGPKASVEAGVTSTPEISMGQLYAGVLSFPVGPLGVMEVLSVFSESMDDIIKKYIATLGAGVSQEKVPFSADGSVVIANPNGWKCVTERVLDGLMSPMTDMEGACPGVHLVEKGYVNVSRDAEYPATTFTGFDKILPFHSMRYYLRRDATWPIPGEFIGLLAKPFPSHVWWFQETSPFLYAGNWFETDYYTSGVVTGVLQPYTKEQLQTATAAEQQALAAFGAPDHFKKNEGMVGLVYKCIVRGVEVCIATSDFCEYAVGDRVAILRIDDIDRSLYPEIGNFMWDEMENLIAWEKLLKDNHSSLPYIVNPNMMILPISFYKPKEVLP